MKMITAKYRPRLAVKRVPDRLDPVEVEVAFDSDSGTFYVCPPDLSSTDFDELVRRWTIFLDFTNLIQDFKMDESLMQPLNDQIKRAYQVAKVSRDKGTSRKP